MPAAHSGYGGGRHESMCDMLNIIYISNGNWETDHRRVQMDATGAFCNLIYIEKPLAINNVIRSPKALANWLKNNLKPRQLGENIQIFKPIAFFPYSVAEKSYIFRMINRFIFSSYIKRRIQLHLQHPLILMLSHPLESSVIGLFSEDLLCYEITDAHDKSSSISEREKRWIEKIEKILLSKADIVFASASSLKSAKQKYNKHIYHIPNAADVAFFAKSLSDDTQVPEDLAQIPSPRIGLIGHITPNVDLEILQMMAQKCPERSIILIGEIKGNRKFKKNRQLVRLKEYPNVYFLGIKPYELLPMYQKGLDVCLLPYKLNEYNKYVYPNKIHQYLAGGKPIVSTNLPEIRPFANLIYIAKNNEEFIEKVSKALEVENSNGRLMANRLFVAKENSVEIRAKQRIALLEKALNNKLKNIAM
jgi:glycosyltransferase involved in cell wall biosynthesis